MISPIKNLFYNPVVIEMINSTLPNLFCHAEMEATKSNSHGPEVGCEREKQVVAFLLEYFGSKNVDKDIKVLEPEVDVMAFKQPVSIKTFTSYSNVRIIWTVDSIKVKKFIEEYKPKCDSIFAYIKWNNDGKRMRIKPGLYYVPIEVQNIVFSELGSKNYLKTPREGTNPRGVSISTEAMKKLMIHRGTEFMPIYWRRPVYETNGYERWRQVWRPVIKNSRQFKSSMYKQNYM